VIAFLRGIIYSVGEAYIDLDVHGVGYRILVPSTWAKRLQRNDELFVHTYQVVREDAVQLYGFETEEDRDWFELLLSVSGVGPKGALQILAGTSTSSFAEAIYTEDLDALCRLPGVGRKTAQRLIVELKDKMPQLWTAKPMKQRDREVSAPPLSSLERDVVEALVSLGYNERQAAEQVRTVLSEDETLSLEDVLRLCLQRMSRQV
jgi:Holliday junction DNA helicase RuvA